MLIYVTPVVGLCNMFCCALLYVHSSLRSSWLGRETWLLYLVCLPGVLWLFYDSISRCRGFVCILWFRYFLIILTNYFCWKSHVMAHFYFNMSVFTRLEILGGQSAVVSPLFAAAPIVCAIFFWFLFVTCFVVLARWGKGRYYSTSRLWQWRKVNPQTVITLNNCKS